MIIGIEGGIGTGKTMSLVHFALQDLAEGKHIYSNIKLKHVPKSNITYLDKDTINNIFERVKDKTLDMRNSTVLLQEIHNYIDSRNSTTKQNRIFTYWILQSRHTGEGSCDIVYDTQDLDQIDKRLRRNTDVVFRPVITEFLMRGKKKIPHKIVLFGSMKKGHKYIKFSQNFYCADVIDKYDTHELVDF